MAKPKEDLVDIFDDDEGWEDMPVVRDTGGEAAGLDEEDQKKYHYRPKDIVAAGAGSNATGDKFDAFGADWRSKATGGADENEYTRLRIEEEDEGDEVHLRTRYLFDEDKAMTPLSQMQATKGLLTEAQRIAYVGLCGLAVREMSQALRTVKSKELKPAIEGMELWGLKIMGRLYYHMEVATEEQKMIESLATHGVQPVDLVPALMTTHTIANPEYDPAEARKQAQSQPVSHPDDDDDDGEDITSTPSQPKAAEPVSSAPPPTAGLNKTFQTTARVLEETTVAVPGVTTSLSTTDEKVTLDIRWTILCDLFLILVADSVYDSRSRVLLEQIALRLGLGWLDVAKFERRVTDALEIQEGVQKLENEDVVTSRQQSSKKRRYVMMGLATLGGGLVIGLSAGLLAPVIGAGIGAALTTVGVTGTTGFLAGAGGAAVITTGGVLTGSSIAGRGMARRTQLVKTFEILPLHNNKRVNCILTVPGFITGKHDDVRLPFSVLDPVVGDVFSVLWEPEMIMETGDALRILTSEVLTQLAQTALQATVMTALMSALQWPLILTKLGYLIDNPWSNALDRARAAGGVLADVLVQRHLGVRPITLIGFSLGARVVFYALLELAKRKAFGVVQDVIMLGATVNAPKATWHLARAVVAGRFVNGYARNDWVLNYLFRATSGGIHTVAGLRPIEEVPGLENVDVTDKISGHMSYRTFMPLILDQLGFPVSADFFDEPVEPEFTEDRIVVREGEDLPKKRGWFGSRKQKMPEASPNASRPPSTASRFSTFRKSSAPASTSAAAAGAAAAAGEDDDELPPRLEHASTSRTQSPAPATRAAQPSTPEPKLEAADPADVGTALPTRAGFDFAAIHQVLEDDPFADGAVHAAPAPAYRLAASPPPERAGSAPLPSRNLSAPPSPPPTERRSSTTAVGEASDNDASLEGGFARSLSFGDEEDPFGDEEDPATPSAGLGRPPAAPTLSFGGADGALWGATINAEETHDAETFTIPALASTAKPSWGADPWQTTASSAQASQAGFGSNPWG